MTCSPIGRCPRVHVSECLSDSGPNVFEALVSMTQLFSVVNSEQRILRGEGSFETTIFACGLRRRRFSVRGPAQAPAAIRKPTIQAPLGRYPGPCSAGPSSNPTAQYPLTIKLSSLHTHPRPTFVRDLLFLLPNFVRPSRSLLSLQSCRAVSHFPAGSSTTSS